MLALQGKIAVITGGSSGIGLATAKSNANRATIFSNAAFSSKRHFRLSAVAESVRHQRVRPKQPLESLTESG